LLATLIVLESAVAQSAATQGGHAGEATSHDGVRIAYELRGDASTALVFVHGWSCDRSYWREQIGPFAQDFTVVAVDVAGHGESGVEREHWTIQAFGADVAAVAEKLALKDIVLIGHSMGGDVIVEAARRLPGRVTGLIWVDTYRQLGPSRSQDEIDTMVAPFRHDFVTTTRTFVRGMFLPGADPELVAWVAEDMSAAPPAIALGALRAAISFDRVIPSALQELKLPVIALNGAWRATDAESLQGHGVRVVIMQQAGHFPMLEDPKRFNAVLRKTIADIRGER
jgi:pimeloyl-ACP methyl ester carboxylesterase